MARSLLLIPVIIGELLWHEPLASQASQAKVIPQGKDTLQTIPQDTTRQPSGIDTVVLYSAKDSIVYSLQSRTMTLYGDADLKYRHQELKAAQIDINWDTATLTSQGMADSAGKIYGEPEFNDAGEVYHGKTIAYNFRTRKGRVIYGTTEIDRGYYAGHEIKKVDKDILYVAGGRYTTCDNIEDPHYYFYSPKMKLIMGDKVIAEPIFLYIADVPVFALPFGVFPSKSGRRSGLIAPAFGEDIRRGKYLTHFGYFWAINDYMDLTTTMDWYTKGGWVLHGSYRYALRYYFGGSISGSFTNTHFGEQIDPTYSRQREYNINIQHHQDFTPSMRADVNFTFLSGSYYQATSTNLNDLLRQNVVSNATLYKSWEGTNNSFSIYFYRDQNLLSGELNQQIPSIMFSHTQSYPFRSAQKGRGITTPTTEELKWYELIGISYTGRFLNSMTKRLVQPLTGFDSLQTKQYVTEYRYGMQHSASINFAPRLGYFTVTPFFSYTELWYPYRIDKHFDPASKNVVTDKVRKFSAVRFFNSGLTASTKFYGIMQLNAFGISGFRHTVMPSLSYTLQPDFSKPFWGYYGSYSDSTGALVTYNRYEQGVFGGAPRGEQQSLSLSVNNLFEMKTLPHDTASEGKKIQLLYLTLGTSYNFAADSMRLSPIFLSYRTSVGDLLTFSGSSTLNPYLFDETLGRRVNRYLWKEKRIPFQMTSISLSISTSLRGEGKSPSESQGSTEKKGESIREEDETAKSGTYGIYDREQPNLRIPWSISLGYNFSLSRDDPRYTFRTSNISANLEFKLTENWRFSMSGSYDFIQKRIAAPSINIYRDLHCWEMLFYWIPSGPYSFYRFEIRLKAPQLHDIKVTKQGSVRGVY